MKKSDWLTGRSSKIKIIGIGKGGINAVCHMYKKRLRDVGFILSDTDVHSLHRSPFLVKILLGESLTEGIFEWSYPGQGKKAAEESIDNIMSELSENTRMVFIIAGMGGGTGTGAIPVIAKACREAGFLTVAVVTIPFRSEGGIRINYALAGIDKLKDHVDSLIIINNETLEEIYGHIYVPAAFARADEVLYTTVKVMTEIISEKGYFKINLDGMEEMLKNSGFAVMGIGTGSGERRAITAIKNALNSPFLRSNNIGNAKNIIVNITSGTGIHELIMDELSEISDYLHGCASRNALIIWGISLDDTLKRDLNITLIASGFDAGSIHFFTDKDKFGHLN